MHKLYLQIYLAFVAIGLTSLAVSSLVVVLHWTGPEVSPVHAIAQTAAVATGAPEQMQAELQRHASALSVDLAVWSDEGQLLASAGRPLPFGDPGWFRRRDMTGVRIALAGHPRILAAAHHTHPRGVAALSWLALVAGCVALGCYPVARRITRRLEGVQEGVQRWGAGDLSARVPVAGHDEVAAVAASFNEAAARVEALFEAQRRVLASASHELRSPLARLRVAVQLVEEDLAEPGWIADAIRDIEDLDATVGDLLRVGRMQALGAPNDPQPVDLGLLLREEAVHVGASVEGPPTVAWGDRRLLRQAVRNLLENAARHGAPPIEARTTGDGVEILDRGEGIDEQTRLRIFEPFFRPGGHDEGRDGGVGLGLHLVREIARHHGGDVTVRGREGGGTAFRLTLPRRPDSC